MKKILGCLFLAFTLTLSACMSAEETIEERKDLVMEKMEDRLAEKYEDEVDGDFSVYDIEKGGNQAWFNYGFYPAKAEYDGDEFKVSMKTDGRKRFDTFEDNYYGILYGEDVKEELEELLSYYSLYDVEIEYLLSEDKLTDEDDLKEHLIIYADFDVYDEDDLDAICELIDELDEEGYQRWIKVHDQDTGKHISTRNRDSDDVRDFFE